MQQLEKNETAKLRHGIKALPRETRKLLLNLLDEEVCRECGSIDLVDSYNERVCSFCGLVQNDGDDRFVGTFRQTSHGDPVCELSYGRSLGDTLPRKNIFQVLAKTTIPNDKDLTPEMSEELKQYLRQNVGLRARFVRIYTSSCDPPFVKRALTFGERFCEEFGIVGDESIQFRDFYGKLLRKVCSLAVLMKQDGETFEAKRFALATFVFVWQLMEIENKIRKQTHYQKTFPSRRTRRRGLKRVTKGRYRIRRIDWEFVIRAHRIPFPTSIRKR